MKPRMPSCRYMRTIKGETFCFFVEGGKMRALPMGQYLANAGFKVRA